jgi:hypothetical protein
MINGEREICLRGFGKVAKTDVPERDTSRPSVSSAEIDFVGRLAKTGL